MPTSTHSVTLNLPPERSSVWRVITLQHQVKQKIENLNKMTLTIPANIPKLKFQRTCEYCQELVSDDDDVLSDDLQHFRRKSVEIFRKLSSEMAMSQRHAVIPVSKTNSDMTPTTMQPILEAETDNSAHNKPHNFSLDSKMTNLKIHETLPKSVKFSLPDLESSEDGASLSKPKKMSRESSVGYSAINPIYVDIEPDTFSKRGSLASFVRQQTLLNELNDVVCENAGGRNSLLDSSWSRPRFDSTCSTNQEPLVCKKCLKSGSISLDTNWPYDENLQNFINSTPTRQKFPLTTTFFSLVAKHYEKFKNLIPNEEIADKLCQFMHKIEKCYQDVPYHSKIHAVDVLAACEVLSNQLEKSGLVKFSDLEKFTILLAAACHDVGHPSVNSHYIFSHETASVQELKDFGEIGLLEQAHSQIALNFLQEVGLSQFYENSLFLEMFEFFILSTDMTLHNQKVEKLAEFVQQVETDQLNLNRSFEKRKNILAILLHISDLSNPTKNFEEAESWADKVHKEFFQQGDIENFETGTISSKFFDRKNTNFEESQVAFINFVVTPIVDNWCKLFKKVGYQAGLEIGHKLRENKEIYTQKINSE